MNRSERKEYRDEKKKLRRERKRYFREEKESAKRQKKELKENRKDWQRKHGQKFYWRILSFFSSSTKKISREERLEKLEMRARVKKRRKQIRKIKRQQLWNRIIRWLKNPFSYRRLGRREKLMREQAKVNLKKEKKHQRLEIRQKRRLAVDHFLFQRKQSYKDSIRSLSDFFRTIISIIKLKPLQRDYLKTLINSTFLFILSFFIIQYISQFITIFMAKTFDIPAVLYSYRIFWPLYTYSSLYTRPALILIFGVGPLVCLIIGFGLYRIYLWIRKYNLVFKTFNLWLIFHAFNMFFGAYVIGVITRTGFIYTSEWIFLSNVFDVEEIVFMIICLFTLALFGYLSTRQFIYAANSEIIIEHKLRLYYLISMVLLPWIFGNLILYFMNYPRNPIELVLFYLISSLMIIPVFTNFNSLSIKMVKIPNLSGPVKFGWIYIFLTIVAIILIRSFVYYGIRFS